MGIVGLAGVGFPTNPQSYKWGRRRSLRSDPGFCGRPEGYELGIQDPADFCRKMAAVFGAEVYRNSTGVLVLGKSAGKDSRAMFVIAELNASFSGTM
jgi:hypothetical protein